MKYVLIMTASYYNVGLSVHSIEFNDEIAAHAAGQKWYENVNRSVNAYYTVVESP